MLPELALQDTVGRSAEKRGGSERRVADAPFVGVARYERIEREGDVHALWGSKCKQAVGEKVERLTCSC